MIVDFHAHAFPDEIAPKAMETLYTRYQMTPFTDGTAGGLSRCAEAAGVDLVVIQPVATKASQVRSINDWAAALDCPRVVSFGALHPDLEDVAGEVDRMVSLGLKGVKIHGNWQDTYVNDPRMFPIYEAARGRLICMFHAGDELTPFDPQKATPAMIADVHSQFPDLTIIAAHMGGYLMWTQAEDYLVGKNVYLDTSACWPRVLDDNRMLSMIRRHGADRIVFATDLPMGNPQEDIARLGQLGLTDTELETVLGGNAARMLGL